VTFLRVEGLWKRNAGQPVLRGVDLDVPSQTIVALLGASGCGKTTLLRLIAGFDAAEDGRIVMDGRVLEQPGQHVPAEQRHIGYVPQEGTLFPHLTVADNVGFGLSRAQRRAGRVEEALALTGLSGLERRYPHQISGGQQQRTALARALAPRPGLILLDEPFAALDLALRRTVCADVVALLRQNSATAILVTHDPQEAFISADIVAVMREGKVVQCDTPATIYRRPADAAVAELTGAAILLPGEARDGRVATALGSLELYDGTGPAGCVTAMLRPEQIRLAAPGEGTAAKLLGSVFHGDHTLVTVGVGDARLELRLAVAGRLEETLYLRVAGPCVAFGARDGGEAAGAG
jgi:iron(III) transport system ATP-binding protein